MQGKTFIISLTTLSDDPHMWTAYGDGGNGVCIGIESNYLIRWKRIGVKNPECNLLPCCYNLNILTKKVMEFAKRMCNKENLIPLDRFLYYEQFKYKDRSFIAEKEWRGVIHDFPSNTEPIHGRYFFEITLPIESISSIAFGRKLDNVTCNKYKHEILELLSSKGSNPSHNIKFKRSSI